MQTAVTFWYSNTAAVSRVDMSTRWLLSVMEALQFPYATANCIRICCLSDYNDYNDHRNVMSGQSSCMSDIHPFANYIMSLFIFILHCLYIKGKPQIESMHI